MAASGIATVLRVPSSARASALRLMIPCGASRLVYRGCPLIMGVLNVTPDSFSDGARFLDADAAIRQGRQLVAEGADLLDVGGESTRPGAEAVSLQEELRRVIPVVSALARTVRVPLSIDTSKAEVAAHALEAGASLVNDVTALQGDPQMAAVVARHQAAVILMHMRGTPRTMQRRPRYADIVSDVAAFLRRAAARARQAGIDRSRILLDPGLGFGKTARHNLTLMRQLNRFVSLGFPVVVGPSRKSFIGRTLNTDVSDRLAGTLACVAYAQRCGVHIVRVHDVKPAVEVVRMLAAIEGTIPHASWREH